MLQIKHISKQYQTGELIQQALNDVSLNLRDSEFVAILGPSGSGKTTLLNIIGGLDRYDSGDLIINGTSTREYNDRNWDTYRNHSIGFVFQSYNLIQHQTVLSNVELALTIAGLSAKERKERAIRTLEQVGLGNQLHKKPNQMSGGQMQRVALARALVNDPDILLADEPTGALDSETSRQVMDLMQQVAKDRLVVMVTHNPELAEEYASRIVRVKDGKIIDDTMPFTDVEIAALQGAGGESNADFMAGAALAGAAAASVQEDSVPLAENGTEKAGAGQKKSRKKQASMSFLTSLALSFSNLRTKKGRTILTSFAGSIGIIGIALILSLSNGVNDYIAKIQRDTMTSYPITVSSTSLNFASFMTGDSPAFELNQEEEQEREAGKVYASFRDMKVSSTVSSSIRENNLTDFKKYLDDPNSEIQKYIGEHGIVYTYNVDFKVYTHDKNGKLVDTDADVTSEFSDENNILGNLLEARSLMLSNMSTMFGGGPSQTGTNFTEMMAGTQGDAVSAIIKDNYDVVYGSWPERYDQVVLVLNSNDTLTSGTLYQLGLITKEEYRKAVRLVEKEEEPDPISFDYKDLCGQEFLLLTNSDQYRKNPNGTFSRMENSEKQIEEALKGAVRLHISGIIKEKEDADITNLNTPVAYTTMLTDYMIAHGNESEIVKAQQASPDTDVLSGQKFLEEEPSDAVKAAKAEDYLKNLSEGEKSELFTSLMMIDYEGGMEALMTTQMEALSRQVGPRLQQAIGSAIGDVMQQAAGQFMEQLSGQMQKAVAQMIEQSIQQVMEKALMPALKDILQNFMKDAMQQVMQQAMGQVMQQITEKVLPRVIETVMQQAMEKIMPQLMEKVMPQVMEAVMREVMQQISDQVTPQMMEAVMQQVLEKALPQVLDQVYQKMLVENVQKAVRALQDQISGTLPAELTPFLSVSSWDDFVQLINETDFSSIDFGSIDLSQIDLQNLDYNTFDWNDLDFSQIDFSGLDLSQLNLDLSKLDFSKLDLSKLDLSGLDLSALDLSQLDLSQLDLSSLDFSDLDLSGMDLSKLDFSKLDLSQMNLSNMDLSKLDFSQMDFSGLDFSQFDFSSLDFSQLDLSGLSSAFEGLSLSMGASDLSQIIDYWKENIATQQKLVLVFDRFIGNSDYDSNLKNFGLVSYDAPSTISLYADSFEAKDGIAASIRHYNEAVEKEDQINYTDYVALLTTSITTIIDAISYVLIGFVGVSLFVSCIMIGVITNISVLERTKEIGVLRALGASKRNISNVFNAETFIIGCLSGLIGVGISLLLILPINAIVHSLMDSTVLSAKLPPLSAGILVLISIAITMIGGLIPASKAANKDPVEALRSE